jgi:hypothetical protein
LRGSLTGVRSHRETTGKVHETTPVADELADLQQRVLDSVASVPGVDLMSRIGIESASGAGQTASLLCSGRPFRVQYNWLRVGASNLRQSATSAVRAIPSLETAVPHVTDSACRQKAGVRIKRRTVTKLSQNPILLTYFAICFERKQMPRIDKTLGNR